MIIGFGKVEDVYEEQVAEHFRRAAIKAMREGPGYIDDATENRLRKWLDTEGAESRKLADAHDIAASPPDRYTSWYGSLASYPSGVVAILRFHHIMRKHALSPDGWAGMTNKRLVHVDVSEGEAAEAAKGE